MVQNTANVQLEFNANDYHRIQGMPWTYICNKNQNLHSMASARLNPFIIWGRGGGICGGHPIASYPEETKAFLPKYELNISH